MTPATLLDSVVFGAVSQTFPDGSEIPDLSFLVPRGDQLDVEPFEVSSSTMTAGEDDASLVDVEETVLRLMSDEFAEAPEGWTVSGGQDPNYQIPKVARNLTSDRFSPHLIATVSAEHRHRHERPHSRQRLSLGIGLTDTTTGTSFGSVLRLSRAIRDNSLVRQEVYYSWQEPVTDAMLAGAGVLHDGRPMTAAELYALLGPWEGRAGWCKMDQLDVLSAEAFHRLAAASTDPLTELARGAEARHEQRLGLK